MPSQSACAATSLSVPPGCPPPPSHAAPHTAGSRRGCDRSAATHHWQLATCEPELTTACHPFAALQSEVIYGPKGSVTVNSVAASSGAQGPVNTFTAAGPMGARGPMVRVRVWCASASAGTAACQATASTRVWPGSLPGPFRHLAPAPPSLPSRDGPIGPLPSLLLDHLGHAGPHVPAGPHVLPPLRQLVGRQFCQRQQQCRLRVGPRQ